MSVWWQVVHESELYECKPNDENSNDAYHTDDIEPPGQYSDPDQTKTFAAALERVVEEKVALKVLRIVNQQVVYEAWARPKEAHRNEVVSVHFVFEQTDLVEVHVLQVDCLVFLSHLQLFRVSQLLFLQLFDHPLYFLCIKRPIYTSYFCQTTG